MSKTDELLNGLTDDEISAHTTDPDDEPHIVINEDRSITIPEELARIAVQFDHNIETVTFDCPRYWDGLDISNWTIYINYLLSDGTIGSFAAESVTVDIKNTSIVHFTWTITEHLTQVSGPVSFLVCARNVDEDGMVLNDWNSELGDGLVVSKGLRHIDTNPQMYPDIIVQILKRLDTFELKNVKVFVKYSDLPDGDGYSNTWDRSMPYMGIAVAETEPTHYQKYTWFPLVTYGKVFVRYSTQYDGDDAYTEEWKPGQEYIGYAIGTDSKPPQSHFDYIWHKIPSVGGGSGGSTGGDTSGLEARIEAIENELNYTPINFTSFALKTPSTTTFELGQRVSSVYIDWVLNKPAKSITVNGGAVSASSTSYTDNTTYTSSKTWTVVATEKDTKAATASRSATINFYNGVYYGVMGDGFDESFINEYILNNLTKTLRGSKLTSFSANAGAGEYIYYCLPKRMGACSFKVGGFDGGFSLIYEGAFTNASGYTEDYYVYRSDNPSLGSTSVTVS